MNTLNIIAKKHVEEYFAEIYKTDFGASCNAVVKIPDLKYIKLALIAALLEVK